MSSLRQIIREVVSKGTPKFKKGDKVLYIPKLSGLNPNKKLTISNVSYKNGDAFTSPGWYYTFHGIELSAIEKDLKPAL